MDKINKLSLPATILIASIILGGFYYASQVYKQKSIERQQQIKTEQDEREQAAKIKREKQEQLAEIKQETQEQLAKELKEQEAKAEAKRQADLNASRLDICLDNALTNYRARFKDECKSRGLKEDCSLPLWIAEALENSLIDAKSDCFKKYPQK